MNESDPLKRFCKLVGWMLSNWSTIPRKGISGCKPYNPVLGEQFFATYEHENSNTEVICEQVSHHPPISAFYVINEKAGFAYSGWVYPNTYFSVNSVVAKMDVGFFRLDLLKTNEQFKVLLPSVSAGGLLVGEQTIEIFDKFILLGKDYKASLDFYLNKNNQLDGGIYDLKTKERVYMVNGNVDGLVSLTDPNTGMKSKLYDAKELKLQRMLVANVNAQKPVESRRTWHRVSCALLKGDFETAAKEKHELEEKERKLRKEREAAAVNTSGHNEAFSPELFEKVGEHWVYKKSILPKMDSLQDTLSEDTKSWGNYIKSFIW